jgi:hypothetical protein
MQYISFWPEKPFFMIVPKIYQEETPAVFPFNINRIDSSEILCLDLLMKRVIP